MTPRKATTIRRNRQVLFLMVMFSMLSIFSISAQAEEPVYDEIEIFIEFPGVGGSEIPAVIKEDELFLPVTIFFNLFKIKNTPDPEFNNISGFLLNPEASYHISREKNTIEYQGKTHNLSEGDLVRTEYDLFLRSDYYGKIFGLECFFNFRNLSVTVKSRIELPLLREIKQEELRKNLSRLKGEMIPDTTIGRSYPLFRFGMADWSIVNEQNTNSQGNTRLNLSLGAMLAGGEATASVYYNSMLPFSEKMQHYMWRYVDNDFRYVRQIMVGKVEAQSTSSLFNPMVGVQLTNSPTTYRRSFGTYTLTDRTEPDWMVELYINNVLIDYVKADAGGFYRFEIPLVYGNSLIQLKFYGPWGEEKVKEQNINVPYSFIPEKTLEYKLSAGVVEDSSFSRFSRLSMNYGVSRRFTLGGGYEYLSTLTSSPVMPYLSASLGLTDNLLLAGEYTHGVRAKGTISYRTISNIDLEATYIKYVPGQKAIIYNYLEERKASVSIPLRFGHFNAYNRFSLNQFVLPSLKYSGGEIVSATSKYSTAVWLVSGSVPGIAASLSTQAVFLDESNLNINSNLSFSIRSPGNILIISQMQYAFSRNEFISSKVSVEKRIRDKAFINASVERNFLTELTTGEIGFRYNFSFGQAGASVRRNRDNTYFVEHARGSLIYDGKTDFLKADNKFNVGRGGISFIPFVDLNANGRKDNGEPKAYGLNIKTLGGYVQKSLKDTTIHILGLEPYTKCFVELDQNSFENISWKLPYEVLAIMVDPDIVKHVEIPVIVVGEAAGNVFLDNKGTPEGVGRIIVNFFTKDGTPAGSTLSENDGYFSFFGLRPGDYYAGIDSPQLNRLGMQSVPLKREFIISEGFDGDIAEGLDFNLRLIESDLPSPEIRKSEPVIRKDTSIMIIHEVVEELVTITNDSWAIQLGAFKNRTNADNLRRNLERMLGKKVDIIIADGFFKVRINEIQTRDEVDEIIEILRKNGITELWLISLKAKQQMIVQRDVQDSVITIVDTFEEEPAMFESKIFAPLGESFYNLDRKPIPLIDQTVIDIMETRSSLDEIKLKDIRTVTRIVRTDTTEIVIPGAEAPKKLAKAGSYRVAGEEISVNRITIPFNAPLLSQPVEKAINTGEAPAKVSVPEISLQVGIYYKKSEALRAQKKIMSKLNVPVKVVEQWEYFRVIITGFNSREETYQYYPELAGLGFPGVKLIEE